MPDRFIYINGILITTNEGEIIFCKVIFQGIELAIIQYLEKLHFRQE